MQDLFFFSIPPMLYMIYPDFLYKRIFYKTLFIVIHGLGD